MAQNYCLDCSTDSVNTLRQNARTPKDSLIALVALIDNVGGPPVDLEYKIDLLNQLERLNERVKLIDLKPYVLYREGLQLWLQNKAAESIVKQKEAIELFDRQNKILGNQSMLNGLRLFFLEAGMLDERLSYYRKKLGYYAQHGPIENTAACYHSIAGSNTFYLDYDEALRNYLKAMDVFKTFSKSGYANENVQAGRYYYEWGNNEKSRIYLERGVQLATELKLWRLVAEASKFLALINKSGKMYPEAIRAIDYSLLISDTMHSNRLKAFFLAEKAGILIEMGEWDAAKYILDNSLYIKETESIPIAIALGYYEGDYYVSKYFMHRKDYSNAEKHLVKAYQESEKLKVISLIQKYRKELADFYLIRGNNALSAQLAASYIKTHDSLNKVYSAYNIANFENELKEAENKNEQDKKDALAQKKLQRQKLIRNGLIAGFLVVVLFAGMFFFQRNKIKKEKKLSDKLLLNILPEEVAEELKSKGSADAKQFDQVTVMFTDFKGFTQITEKLSPALLVAEIHNCFKAFDNIIGKYNIEKIKTIGDAYMCAGGLPVTNKTHAEDVVKAAIEIQHFMLELVQQRKNEGKDAFEIRIGVHTGPVVAGIVGVKKFAYDIWGDTVNIASRMESSGEVGKVNISGSTYDLIKNKFLCSYRGKIQAKNKGEIDMYFVEDIRNE